MAHNLHPETKPLSLPDANHVPVMDLHYLLRLSNSLSVERDSAMLNQAA